VTDPERAAALPDGRGELRFEGVDFAYPGSTEPALQGVDLTIAPGETVALVGATGSGKSTLAALVPRLDDPTAGRVLLDGVDLRELALADVRSAVGVVFEETVLFEGTIADNIRFGAPDASEHELRSAAHTAGAH